MVAAHIEVENLVHEYDGRRVVEVDRLTVERGRTLALIGPNGSGKSTLLRLIGLLEKPTAGSIRIESADPWTDDRELEFRRQFAAVFQEPLLFSGSVFDNVSYGLKIRRTSANEIKRRTRGALEIVGIADLEGRSAKTLSGGEAQRTSLARALALEPKVLLLDEPLASLDPPTRESLLDDFDRILKDSGVTTIFVTHDRTEALRLGDAVAVMVEGSIDQIGAAGEVFTRPLTVAVADIVGCDNRLPGRITEAEEGLVAIDIGGAEIDAVCNGSPGEDVLACIRPEDITLFTGETPASSARNRLVGTITKLVNLGALSRVTVEACIELVAFVTKKSIEEMELGEGSQVTVAFKATGVHVIRNDRKAGDEKRDGDNPGGR